MVCNSSANLNITINIPTSAQKNMNEITGRTRFWEFFPKKPITPFSIIFCMKNMMLPNTIDAKTGPTIK